MKCLAQGYNDTSGKGEDRTANPVHHLSHGYDNDMLELNTTLQVVKQWRLPCGGLEGLQEVGFVKDGQQQKYEQQN